MRKSFVALSLLMLAAAAVWYVYGRLDLLVQRSIEEVGSTAAGTKVQVEAVAIDLRGATATIRGLTLANPQGFSETSLLRLGELVLTLDPARLSKNSLGISNILVRDSHLRYEQREGQSNLQALMSHFAGPEAQTGASASRPSSPQSKLAIDRILLEQVTVTLHDRVLPVPVEVALGDFVLLDLAGSPPEVAQQILGPLLGQLSDKAGTAMLAAAAAQVGADVRSVGRQALEQAGQGLRAVGESLGEAGSRVREGLGNLFRSDGEETDEALPQQAESTAQ